MLPALIDLLKAKQEDDEIVLQVMAVDYNLSNSYTGFPLSDLVFFKSGHFMLMQFTDPRNQSQDIFTFKISFHLISK